mgnify:CR=1 FL=1
MSFLVGILTTLVFSFTSILPGKAAERIVIELEDMSLPISVEQLVEWVEEMSIPNSIKELSEWARNKDDINSELSNWLNLLEMESRGNLVRILKSPFIKDRSMAMQLLRSWMGRKLLDEISDLVRLDNDSSGKQVLVTLEFLVNSQKSVNTLDLLQALPAETIYLDLDGLIKIANQWKNELKNQQQLVVQLSELKSNLQMYSNDEYLSSKKSFRRSFSLDVNHRLMPLELEIWNPAKGLEDRPNWLIFMPGLGGDVDHFRWLARLLSESGWPVVLLQHPGSDGKAVQELLEGKRPLPGAEVIPERLSDLSAVISAQKTGELPVMGEKLILMGHSLGALTAFLASGSIPDDDLAARCQTALKDLSLTNLSKLLQCQLIDVELKQISTPEINGIIALNSFGSLLWPSPVGIKNSFPILITGGTYDLITPALSEQLGLFLSTSPNKKSMVLLIQGASHFSPIRVEGQLAKESGDDLFQLGESLVGVQPLIVQKLLASEIINFLKNLEDEQANNLSRKQEKYGLSFYTLDRESINQIIND